MGWKHVDPVWLLLEFDRVSDHNKTVLVEERRLSIDKSRLLADEDSLRSGDDWIVVMILNIGRGKVVNGYPRS